MVGAIAELHVGALYLTGELASALATASRVKGLR